MKDMRAAGSRSSADGLRRGFTLVELMLVITIMGIMLGAITPTFKPFLDSQTLKNATSSLAQIIRFVRSMAVEQSAVVQITFDKDTGGVLVAMENDPINMPGVLAPVALPVRYPKEYQEKVRVASIVKQTLFGTQQEDMITFQPDGTTSDTFIYLVDEYENTYTIGIVGLMGQVMTWNHAVDNFYE
ncbi:MAG: GspH/FimT family pseudopilin [Candidatus Omnitrophica bacterium]|nr:GspH/FimT family pseudopilin [Candidatus Omnitrophota bacterium]